MSAGRDRAIERARIVKDVLLDFGVPEVSIEVVEGRPVSGDRWNALRPFAVTSHHIVSNPTPSNPTPGLHLVTVGTSALGGPLCNGTAGVDLVYRIKCLGLANHPGYGGPLTVRGPMGSYTIPKDNARPYAWGTEYEGGLSEAVWDRTYTNRRTGKSMTFREFMGRANAGLTHAIWRINGEGKRPARSADLSGYHMEHKTWAPTRKIDRLGYTTSSGRAEVRRFGIQDEQPPQEDEMQLSDDIYPHPDKSVSVAQVLRRLDAFMEGSYRRDRAIKGLLRDAIDKIDQGATPQEIKGLLEAMDVSFTVVVNDDQIESGGQ